MNSPSDCRGTRGSTGNNCQISGKICLFFILLESSIGEERGFHFLLMFTFCVIEGLTGLLFHDRTKFNCMLMILISVLKISLPLQNPVLLFSLILFIILFAPILLNKIRIPHLIGLIVAGALIGPYGFNLMSRDSSIILFGTVGLLYIMFLSGLDTNLRDFKKNFRSGAVFSLLTFLIPMVLGTFSTYYLLGFSWLTSVLLASMYASNTLITYPMVSKLGIQKNKVVNIAVTGTLVDTILALMVLAVVVGMTKGEVNQVFWLRISISLVVFIGVVLFFFPMIARWFFKRYHDNISQYIFVLGMIYLGAFLAETAGIDKVVGAFLAGLALNSLIPQTSPLMNRISFVGNALFIPFFLIGVGMLINYQAFFKDVETIVVAVTMTVVATFSKYSAAWLTQKIFHFSKAERTLLFGLTNSQAASTLAAVLVGYNIIVGEDPFGQPVRLLSESILNGTILMILSTCTIASFATQKGGQKIALLETAANLSEGNDLDERILVPVSDRETTVELINLGVLLKSKKNGQGLYALNIIAEGQANSKTEKEARTLLHLASVTGSASDNQINGLLRYDFNVINGISNVVKEQKITDVIMGLHKRKGLTSSFLGHFSDGILTRCNTTTMIYRSIQPVSTIKRHVVVLPENAEREIGFSLWFKKIVNITRNTGSRLMFYGPKTALDFLAQANEKAKLEIESAVFSDWNDFLILTRELRKDDNLVVVMSRKDHLSYNPTMNRIPFLLNRYFAQNSFMLVYPVQMGVSVHENPLLTSASMHEPLSLNQEGFDNLGRSLGRIFEKKEKI